MTDRTHGAFSKRIQKLLNGLIHLELAQRIRNFSFKFFLLHTSKIKQKIQNKSKSTKKTTENESKGANKT